MAELYPNGPPLPGIYALFLLTRCGEYFPAAMMLVWPCDWLGLCDVSG